MSAKDWYARKFGQPQSMPPAAPPQHQQQAPSLQRFGAPPGQQDPRTEAEALLAKGDVAGAAALWQGGEATRTEKNNCPECGSGNYFSRTNRAQGVNPGGGASGQLITQQGRMQVAPHCFDCGFNGLYDLSG